eukprot:4166284-Prymnesium_polylepis.1
MTALRNNKPERKQRRSARASSDHHHRRVLARAPCCQLVGSLLQTGRRWRCRHGGGAALNRAVLANRGRTGGCLAGARRFGGLATCSGIYSPLDGAQPTGLRADSSDGANPVGQQDFAPGGESDIGDCRGATFANYRQLAQHGCAGARRVEVERTKMLVGAG